jgi:hypothetical protein
MRGKIPHVAFKFIAPKIREAKELGLFGAFKGVWHHPPQQTRQLETTYYVTSRRLRWERTRQEREDQKQWKTQKMINLLRSGRSPQAISKYLNIGYYSVLSYLHDAGQNVWEAHHKRYPWRHCETNSTRQEVKDVCNEAVQGKEGKT